MIKLLRLLLAGPISSENFDLVKIIYLNSNLEGRFDLSVAINEVLYEILSNIATLPSFELDLVPQCQPSRDNVLDLNHAFL